MSKRHLLLLLPLLAACQPPQPVVGTGRPVASETAVAHAPDAVADSVRQVLTQLSGDPALVSVRNQGEAVIVEGEFPEAAFDAAAVCPRITLYDPWTEDRSQRFRWVNASTWNGAAKVVIRPAAEGSTVLVEARFLGTYLNSYTGWPEERLCRSTGEVENTLLKAARGGA